MDARELLALNPLPALQKLTQHAGRRGVRRAHRPPRPARTRLISIIVPAHNEESYLGRTLDSLRNQNYPDYEVIVVANGCTDRTADVARGRCDRLLVLSQKSIGVSRNLGARMARGELLVFLDADTELEPLALRLVAENFSRSHAAATLKGRPDHERLAYRVIYFFRNLTHRWLLHKGSSGVIICWKEHFFQSGGFDEGLAIRENSELIKRLCRFGRYKYIGDAVATTSMRRFDHCGLVGLTWLWAKLWWHCVFGDLHHRQYDTVR
jgi:glycosyltransferase involved in cell wall biosynthesis